MMHLTPKECRRATGGQLINNKTNQLFQNICTDSRQIEFGDVFLAISGDKFDAHDFLETAIQCGAVGLIVEEAKIEKAKDAVVATEKFPWILAVEDTTLAYGQIGHAWRKRTNPKVVAITGSNGKTSVKEMAAQLCADSLSVFATAGNENNHIGLPRNLMRLGIHHEAAILEVGMNHRGELTYLTELCDPDICVITNVGEAHVGNFTHPDELIDAKGELFEATRRDGIGILNIDCPNASKLLERDTIPENILTFGNSEKADVRATNMMMSPYAGLSFDLTFQGETVNIRADLFGLYQVTNILAAASIALNLGVSLEEISRRIRTFKAPKMRSQVCRYGSVTVIEDCYNSSPTATKYVIHSLNISFPKKRKILILGDMYELGKWEEDYHRQIGRECVMAKADVVIGVGPRAAWICDEVSKYSSIQTYALDDADDTKPILLNEIHSDDVILLKGSRACRLERLMGWFESTPWIICSRNTGFYAPHTD